MPVLLFFHSMSYNRMHPLFPSAAGRYVGTYQYGREEYNNPEGKTQRGIRRPTAIVVRFRRIKGSRLVIFRRREFGLKERAFHLSRRSLAGAAVLSGRSTF